MGDWTERKIEAGRTEGRKGILRFMFYASCLQFQLMPMKEIELPITSLHAAFQTAFAKQPVIITALTGSGKSTMVPLWCAELSEVPILVMEPRRIACRSLAR